MTGQSSSGAPDGSGGLWSYEANQQRPSKPLYANLSASQISAGELTGLLILEAQPRQQRQRATG